MSWSTPRILLLATAALAAIPTPRASATPFADALADYSSKSSALVLDKLVTFKVGAKCAARLPKKEEGALHAASFATRDLLEYAKAVTGDDWTSLDAPALEPKLDGFKSRFSMSVTVDGDDCDAKQSSLWLGAWTTLATSLRNSPPPAAKVSVSLTVSSKTRDVTVVVGKDGSSFVVTAPKDIEAPNWSDKLDKPFRKLVVAMPDDFSFEVKESGGRYSSAWVLTKLTTFKVGKKCLAKLADKGQGAIHMAGFYTRDILQYVKLVGGDDWDQIEQQSANDPKTNRDIVEKMMDEWKPRLHVTVTVEGDDCDAKSGARWLSYWGQIATSLKSYPPKAKTVKITLNVTSKVKDVSVTAGKDGATFAITAPLDNEAAAWTDKYDAAFKKVARKP